MLIYSFNIRTTAKNKRNTELPVTVLTWVSAILAFTLRYQHSSCRVRLSGIVPTDAWFGSLRVTNSGVIRFSGAEC